MTTTDGTPATSADTTDTGAADADYAAAGYTGALEPGARPALIIVDPVRAYIDKDCGLYAGVEEPVEQMKVVADAARAAGIPVFITSVTYEADGSDGGVFFRKVAALKAYLPGSPFGAFIDGLEPQPGDTHLTKQYPSAFFGTSLAANLVSRGIDTLVITGLSTSGCVRATTLDAMQSGFIPIVVSDAVGDRLESVHNANLFDIGMKMGEVWSSQRVFDYWNGLAKSPE
ncbi:isochorismatase family protein [Glaciihabitans sp. dw_435]|uniref:isochorismatase family protein n=1 Tax=Glaciihabitans sp. dw_435 TaxID=2720081 RepID=UPI001BD65795|nr:isochorismatase family protein [Glaciihabitans sp. dw_435]